MIDKKEKIAIVTHSFWPENPAIGEALLSLAESLKDCSQPIVITQVVKDFSKKLEFSNRGKGVKFLKLAKFTDSSSHLALRIIELIGFTGFVFLGLCWHRPNKVYVTTSPPIFTPLAVRCYCNIFQKKYIYHMQDIHPEATQIVTGKSDQILKLLQSVDIKTTKKAARVITLTQQMKSYIVQRTEQDLPITLLNNPSVEGKIAGTNPVAIRKNGFVYCGNAGRLQRIPLLLAAIEHYLNEGGELPFIFAGGGVYKGEIEKLASQFSQVSYLGILPADEAAELLHSYNYGLLPIDDEVTNYAFPSKSSSYVFSGCNVIAICGKETSVANWVQENNLGFVVEPNVELIVNLFHSLEKKSIAELAAPLDLIDSLTPIAHAKNLKTIIEELS